LTPLQRDYLAEIYQIGHVEANGSAPLVTTALLAERLLASQSTVNRVVERLRNAGWIEHVRYAGVKLTTDGEDEARAVLRRQAVIEAFLMMVMGFNWHEIYDEARRMRHNVNPALLDRMWQMAGRPARSPFGEPISPDEQPVENEIILADAETKCAYRMTRVLTRQHDRLEYLAALGLRPDVSFILLHRAPFKGPLQIQLGREYRIIGYELATMLAVVPVADI